MAEIEKSFGDALGFVSRRVSGDLDRFKEFVEERQRRPADNAGRSTAGT